MVFRVTAVALLVSLTAFATTQLAADLETLSQSADLIVQGTVVDSKARLTLDGRRVVTDTRLQVGEVLKGSAKGEIVVMQPGGVVAEIGQKVEGAGTFTAGEEVLVFLEKKGDRYALVGMAQGKFTVERSSDGKAVFAIPNAAEGGLLLDPRSRQPVQTPLVTQELSQLKLLIQKSLKAGPAVPRHP